MRVLSSVFVFCFAFLSALQASPTLDKARELEKSGDTIGARALLAHAAQAAPQDVVALADYAHFLDRYGDPAAKDAYTKLLAAVDARGDNQAHAMVARRLAELSLLE